MATYEEMKSAEIRMQEEEEKLTKALDAFHKAEDAYLESKLRYYNESGCRETFKDNDLFWHSNHETRVKLQRTVLHALESQQPLVVCSPSESSQEAQQLPLSISEPNWKKAKFLKEHGWRVHKSKHLWLWEHDRVLGLSSIDTACRIQVVTLNLVPCKAASCVE